MKTNFCQELKKQFRWSNFGLKYHRYDVFTQPIFAFPAILFVLYRVIIALYFIAWGIFIIANNPVYFGHVQFVYLTTWNYFFCCLYFSFSSFSVCLRALNRNLLKSYESLTWDCTHKSSENEMSPIESESSEKETKLVQFSNGINTTSVNSSSDYDKEEKSKENIPCESIHGMNENNSNCSFKNQILCKIQWMLFNIALSSTLLVCIVYYALIYPVIHSGGFDIGDFHVHGLISIIIFMDLLLNAYPVRLYHAIYPIMLGISYGIFTIIYHFTTPDGNNIIYPEILDWTKPYIASGVILIICVVIFPFFQFLSYLIFCFKFWIFKQCFERRNGNHNIDQLHN